MATDNARYDGAKNKFNVPQETLKANAERLMMKPEEYLQFLNKFVEEYSQNPQFAYQHTDLSDVPVTFERDSRHPDSAGTYYNDRREIVIRPSRDKDDMLRTLIHELAHAAAADPIPGYGGAGNMRNRMGNPRTSESEQGLEKSLTQKGMNYGPGELQAFMTEFMHPVFRQNKPFYVRDVLNKNEAGARDYYQRVAQPTRPQTTHVKGEQEWTLQEKLLNMFFKHLPQTTPTGR